MTDFFGTLELHRQLADKDRQIDDLRREAAQIAMDSALALDLVRQALCARSRLTLEALDDQLGPVIAGLSERAVRLTAAGAPSPEGVGGGR